jgi:UDP-N-acetylglucosamine transferase subunit ALG13
VILFTVGTHEDPFDRLILAAERVALTTGERVVVQAGTSRVAAPHCDLRRWVPPAEMAALVREARLVVTHAGPSSIDRVLATGKVPLVVPRRADLGEHVDDHQVSFARQLAGRVHVVHDAGRLVEALSWHRDVEERVRRVGEVSPDADRLAATLASLVPELLRERNGRPLGLCGTVLYLLGTRKAR